MITASGQIVNLLDPQPDTILLEDIATHLSRIRRWVGAADISVAAHSLLATRLARANGEDPYSCLWTLLHDAHEAYTGDISTPMKQVFNGPFGVPGFLLEIERTLDIAIRQSLGIEEWHTLEAVSAAEHYDALAWQLERRVLLPDHKEFPKCYDDLPKELDSQVHLLSKVDVKDRFLTTYHYYRLMVVEQQETNDERYKVSKPVQAC
jgi:hypothetical protein